MVGAQPALLAFGGLHACGGNRFIVEVSGSDQDETFFVEKSQLECDELTAKFISLRHNVADGSLIFLRLLIPETAMTGIPVAYEAHMLGIASRRFFKCAMAIACVPPRFSELDAPVSIVT